MGSYHYFFDKDARMDRNKQRALSDNTQEYLAGMEWDVLPAVTVSAGGQRTKYGLGDGGYLSDMSFVTSSYSVGFGAKISIAKNAKLNIAYFWAWGLTSISNLQAGFRAGCVMRACPDAKVK